MNLTMFLSYGMFELLCIELWKVSCIHVLLCLRQIHLLVANISNSKYDFLPHVRNTYKKNYIIVKISPSVAK